MLSHNIDHRLTHRYWIRANEKICIDWMDGECDLLGQYGDGYQKTTRIATFYEFCYPIITFFIYGLLIGEFMFNLLIPMYGSLFIPFMSLLSGLDLSVIITYILIGISIELTYYYYLYKKIGIYIFIPFIAGILYIIFTIVPVVGHLIALTIGVMPWSIFAIGTHYIHYRAGIAVMFNADEKIYTYDRNNIKEYYNNW